MNNCVKCKFYDIDYAYDEDRRTGQAGVYGGSKMLELCLEKNFIGVIENTGQEIFGTVEEHYIKGADKGIIRTFDTTGSIKPFGVTAKLRLVTGEVIEVYKADSIQRLIEV